MRTFSLRDLESFVKFKINNLFSGVAASRISSKLTNPDDEDDDDEDDEEDDISEDDEKDDDDDISEDDEDDIFILREKREK
jgi:hypothetical protein